MNHNQRQNHQYQQQQQGHKRIRLSDSSNESASFDEQQNSNNNNNDDNSDFTTSSSNNIGNINNNFTLNLVDELRKCQREIAGLKAKGNEHAGQFNSLRAENEQLRLKLENVELKAKAETKQMIEHLEAKVAKKSGESIRHMELKLVEYIKKWNEFHKQKNEEVTINLSGCKEAFEAKMENLQQNMGQERAELAKQLTKLVDNCIEQLPDAEQLKEALATVDKLYQSHQQSQKILLNEMPNCRLTLGPCAIGAKLSADCLTATKGIKGPQQYYKNFYANEPFSVPLHQYPLSNQQDEFDGNRRLCYYEVTLEKLSNIDCTISIGLCDHGPKEGNNSSFRVGGSLASIGIDQDGLFGLPVNYYLAAGSNWRIGQNFVEGDTLGCGLLMFPYGSFERHIFFTRNGQMFIEPLLVPSEVDKKLFPSVQLKGKGMIVAQANFGQNPTEKPFRWDITRYEGLQLPMPAAVPYC